jgi:hypothetical protein
MKRTIAFSEPDVRKAMPFLLPKPVLETLEQLQRARGYASEISADPWRFAVEWRLLKTKGLEPIDVRWLFARGFIEARRELSVGGSMDRQFVQHDVPRLTHDTALILTEAGLSFCKATLDHRNATLPDRHPILPAPDDAYRDIPRWDCNRNELTFRGQLVKIFRRPATNQQLILSAFEEEGWPEFIHDPLPHSGTIDPHQRLQSTIKSLNRHQMVSLIRFRGNGGTTVFWDILP